MSNRTRNLLLLRTLVCNPLVTEAEARTELGLPGGADREDPCAEPRDECVKSCSPDGGTPDTSDDLSFAAPR